MRILINEDKRDKLAKQILTDVFSKLDFDISVSSSNRGARTFYYDNGVDNIIAWGEDESTLFFCDDVILPIRGLGYTPQKIRQVVGEWFSETYNKPVDPKKVHQVSLQALQ